MPSAITSGCTMSKPTDPLPDWEHVLSSAARLQQILPACARISVAVFDRVCDAAPK